RLAETDRAPLVLYYLEERTREEAARQLGWSLGTFKRRLEQAKARLRERLARRDLALPAGVVGGGAGGGPGRGGGAAPPGGRRRRGGPPRCGRPRRGLPPAARPRRPSRRACCVLRPRHGPGSASPWRCSPAYSPSARAASSPRRRPTRRRRRGPPRSRRITPRN